MKQPTNIQYENTKKSRFVGARLSQTNQSFLISTKFLSFKRLRFIRIIFIKCAGDVLGFVGVLRSQKINHIGFGSQGHVQKSRNHRNEGFRVLSYATREVVSSK